MRSATAVTALVLVGCSGSVAGIPCISDENCADDAFCGDDQRCVKLAPGFQVTITPPPLAMTTGKSVHLSAPRSGAVTWSVQEAGGGTIDAGGTYQAPATPGKYHVIARSLVEQSRTASVEINVVAPPALPALSAPSKATAGKTGLAARVVPALPDLTYRWSIAGGTLTSEATGASVTFTAGAGGQVTLTCTAVNAAGDTVSADAVVGLVAPPVAPAIAAPVKATRGTSRNASVTNPSAALTYHWAIEGGALNSSADAASVNFTAGAGAQVTLSCTAVNAAGDTLSADAVVNLVAPSVAPAIGAPLYATRGTSRNASVTNVSSGLTYHWEIEGSVFTSSADATSISFTAGTGASARLLCTATNEAGDGAQSAQTVGLVDPPVAAEILSVTTAYQRQKGLTASVTSPRSDHTYTWVISGGTATSGANTTTVTYTAGSGASLELTCTATNLAGDPAQKRTTVSLTAPTPVVAPEIVSHTFVLADRTGSAKVKAPVAGLTYQWTVQNGTFLPSGTTASGALVDFAPSTSPVQLTCTAVNEAGETAPTAVDVASDQSGLMLIAGTTGGRGYLDGPVASSEFNTPTGIAVDPDGNVYTAEPAPTNAVREIGADGVVTTLAGGQDGFVQQDGTGTGARFNGLQGIAFADANTLFTVSDRVAKVAQLTRSGGAWHATTIAGAGVFGFKNGAGLSAEFRSPRAIAVVDANTAYVADLGNYAIRAVQFNSGAWDVSTVAGGTHGTSDGTGLAAQFDFPWSISAAGPTMLFVADNAIRKLDLSSGDCQVTTPLPASAFASNRATAVGAVDAHHLFVADSSAVYAASDALGTWSMSRIAGSTTASGWADGPGDVARFSSVSAIAALGLGAAWVTDGNNGLIRKVSFESGAWQVTTVGGTRGTDAPVNAPSGPGFDARIVTRGEYDYASVAALDDDTFVFVDAGLRKAAFDGTRWTVTTLMPSFSGTGLAVADPSTIYFVRGYQIFALTNGSSGWTESPVAGDGTYGHLDGDGAAAQFAYPAMVAVADANNLFVADADGYPCMSGCGAIRQLTWTGSVWHVSTPIAPFNGIKSVTAADASTLYATDAFGVYRVAKSGDIWSKTLIAGANGDGYQDGPGETAMFFNLDRIIAAGPTTLFVADKNNGAVRKLTSNGFGWTVSTAAGMPFQRGLIAGPLPTSLNAVARIARTPSGEIVILNENALLLLRP